MRGGLLAAATLAGVGLLACLGPYPNVAEKLDGVEGVKGTSYISLDAGAARILILAPAGRIDNETSPAFQARLIAQVTDAKADVVIDFARVEYISSAGIRSVVRARKALEGRGGRVALVGLQPPVQKVFDIVKALPASQIFASVAELDAYLDAMQRRAGGG